MKEPLVYTEAEIKKGIYDEKKDLSHSKYEHNQSLGKFLQGLSDSSLEFFFSGTSREEILDWVISTGVNIYAAEMGINPDHIKYDLKLISKLVEAMSTGLYMEKAYRYGIEELNPIHLKIYRQIRDGEKEKEM
jgi:hypothetical protein